MAHTARSVLRHERMKNKKLWEELKEFKKLYRLTLRDCECEYDRRVKVEAELQLCLEKLAECRTLVLGLIPLCEGRFGTEGGEDVEKGEHVHDSTDVLRNKLEECRGALEMMMELYESAMKDRDVVRPGLHSTGSAKGISGLAKLGLFCSLTVIVFAIIFG